MSSDDHHRPRLDERVPVSWWHAQLQRWLPLHQTAEQAARDARQPPSAAPRPKPPRD